MSELDYSRTTGRQFGQAGSLRSDQMSSMERGDAVNREVADQKRASAFERRVMRQLGRLSRKGDIEAGMMGRQISMEAEERGAPVQGGISSFEENRSIAAGSLYDRNRITEEQDAITNGMESTFMQPRQPAIERTNPTTMNPTGPNPTPMQSGGVSTMEGGAQTPMDEVPPSPSPESGAMSPIDRELLKYGAQVNAKLRGSAGFGNRPNYGLIASRREPAAQTLQTPQPPAPSPVLRDRMRPMQPARINQTAPQNRF